jgi:hypothetical protein
MKAGEVISEMTWRGPSYEVSSQQFADTYRDIWLSNGKYIADIETFKVRKYQNYFSMWTDTDVLVAFAKLIDNEVDDVWVSPEYRKQRLFSQLLWFFKTRLGKSQLIIGSIHSPLIQEVVKGLKYFKKSWVNLQSKETSPFALDTLDNFYGQTGPTDWRLMLENSGDFTGWPMFRNGESFITESYLPYITED